MNTTSNDQSNASPGWAGRFQRSVPIAVAAALLAGLVATANAATTFVKADNTTALNLAGSYTNNAVPTSGDTIQVDSTLTATRSASLGGNLSVYGITQIAGANNQLVIGATSGKTLTNGAGGITMSGGATMQINCALALGANQTWNIAPTAGYLILGGPSFADNGYTLTVNGTRVDLNNSPAVTYGPNVTFTGGQVNVNSSTADAILGGANSFTNLGVYSGIMEGSSFPASTNAGTTSNFGTGNGGTVNLGGNNTSGTLIYRGNTAATPKSFTYDARNNGANTIKVSTSGQTLSLTNLLYANGGSQTADRNWNFGGAGNLAIYGAIKPSGSGSWKIGISKNDAGTLTLAGANTYTGNTYINGGTLKLTGTGSIANSATIFLAGGTTFDVSGLSSTFVLQPGQAISNSPTSLATLAGNLDATSGTLSITFNPGTGPLTISNGALTLSSSTTFNLASLNPRVPPGIYPLITKGSGGGVTGDLPAISLIGATAHLATNVLGGLDVVVDTTTTTATEPLHWAGPGAGTWDVANTGNVVWKDSASPAADVYFLNFDDARFDEQYISANQAVTLDSTVTPASTVVSNTAYTYTISTTSGLGTIAGSGSLIKAGTNTLTLSVSNTFTGGTIVSNGVIKVGNPAALATNGVTVRAGGVLDLNGTLMTNVNAYPLTLNGSGIAGGGALVNGTGAAAIFFGSIALGSDSTIKATTQNLTLGSSGSAVPITGYYALTLGGRYQVDIFGNIQAASVTEVDAGSIRLESANSFAGGLWIKSGTAIAKNGACYGGNGTGTIYLLDTTGTANATLALGASSTFNNPVVVQAGSTGTALINNFGGNYLPVWAAPITLNTNLTLQSQGTAPTGFLMVSGPISGPGGLTIGNQYAADTVKLSGTNTYTGSTYVTVGTLALTNNGSIPNTLLISLASGTTFDVSGLTSKKFNLGSGQTLANSSTGTANLAGTNDASSGAVTVTYDGSTPVFAITSGSLKLSAGTVFTINPAVPLAIGTYNLIVSGVSGVAPASVSIPRRVAHLVINGGGGLDLVINSSTEPNQPLHWAAAGAGLWQVLTPTNVWKDSSLSPVYSYFAGGDQVQFDEQFISADQVVTLNSTVTPASTLVSNATHSYAISGTGTIGGIGGLTKTGAGAMNLSVAGAFTGGTVLANGTLMLGHARALGASGGTVTVNSDAVLDLNGTTMTNANPYALTLNGSGVAGAGALINSSTNQATSYGSIVLDTNSTINAIGATLTLGDSLHTVPITGNYPLTVRATLNNQVRIFGNVQVDSVTKLDAGNIRLESANSFAGGLTVKAGSATAKHASSFGGDGSGTVYLLDTTGGDNATLDLGTSSTFYNSLIVQAGSTGVATVDDYLNYSPTWAGSITLNSDLNLQGSSGQTLAVTGPISGSGGLRITSWNTNGLLNLSGDNTYSGATYVTIGTLALKDAGTLPNSSPISVAGGATFDVSTLYSGIFTLGSGQTLANGLGINLTANLNGNIDASSGAMLVTYDGTTPVFNVSGGVLILAATTAFTVNPTSVLPVGTYNLIASGVSGTTPATVTMLRGAGYLVINGGGGLDLVVTSTASGVTDPLHWAGTGAGLWQVATPGNVWKDSSLAAVFTSYADADPVQFDEKFIAADQVVTLNSTVIPPSVLVSNAAHSYTISGPGAIGGAGGLTKLGSGTFTLTTFNTYTGSTVVSNGALLLNGSINSPVTVNGGTLGGVGFINGTVTVNHGGTLAPGTNGLYRLVITNHLALNTGATSTFAVTSGVPSVNWVQTGGNVTYGGTLNIVPTGTFHLGDQYQLFTGIGATNTSSFASILGSPGSGLTFSFTNGWLGVVTAGPSAPAYLTNSYAGGVLTLSWPTGQGWLLQSNSVSVSDSSAWHTVTGATPPYPITLSPSQTNVFFRLKY